MTAADPRGAEPPAAGPPGAGLRVRPAVDADAGALLDLSVAAIRTSAAGHYTAAQREAWARRRTLAGHRLMVERTTTFVVHDRASVAGFVSVALEAVGGLQRGEVDQQFVSPDHAGRGAARQLLAAVDEAARAAGVGRLVAHASWRAVPVFERAGYRRVRDEAVVRDGEVLTRALVLKVL